VLCVEDTGEKKTGHTTESVARQYIGQLGKSDQGLVSVNGYGVREGIPLPVLCEVFKPRPCLNATERYQSTPQWAIQMMRALNQLGLPFRLVVAASLYGESRECLAALLELDFLVSLRANHGGLVGPGPRVRDTAWNAFDRCLADGPCERRDICELSGGLRRHIRDYQRTTDPEARPEGSTWCVMTNLTGAQRQDVGHSYGLRTWIESGVKPSKQELGWADFRVTSYPAIERWWEMVSRA
jgi:SRSO17 transposase